MEEFPAIATEEVRAFGSYEKFANADLVILDGRILKNRTGHEGELVQIPDGIYNKVGEIVRDKSVQANH